MFVWISPCYGSAPNREYNNRKLCEHDNLVGQT